MKNQKKILFINPPNCPFTSRGILIEPIDLLGLASWVEELGHEIEIIDMDVNELLAKDLGAHIQKKPDIAIIVFDYHIPLHDVGANLQIKAICEWARINNIKTILGGKAATFWDEQKLNRFKADIYIEHEMELALKEILSFEIMDEKSLSTVRGIKFQANMGSSQDVKLIQTPQREEKIDLSILPISNRNLIDLKPYIDVRTMLSSRGCNLKCTFCHVPGFWGWWRGRSASLVVDEIEMLVKDHAAKKILFLDDNAIVHPKRMQEISKELIRRNIQTTLGCLGTIDKHDKATMEKMYEAGFRWIHYGAESGDDNQLKAMGKRINAQKIRETVKQTQQIGMRVRTSWIMDMPELTLEGLLKTEQLILEQGSQEIRLHFLTLRLGSILHQDLQTETPQFIHNGKQNFNISGLESGLIEQSVQRILQGLSSQGYTVVKNAKEFEDIKALQIRSPDLKIVSLCPLRYGLGWER